MLRPPILERTVTYEMIPHMTATAPTSQHATLTTGTRRDSSWMARLVAAKAAGLDELIAFGRELDDDQQAKAWAQWQGYKLWKHSQTGEPLGLIKIATHQPRRVQESYNQGVWHASGPECWFMSTISATNNALAIAAREHTDRAQELLAARANPKHAYILRLLVDAETQGAI